METTTPTVANKPPMPKGLSITAEGKLKAELLHDFDKYSSGSMLMCHGGGEVTEGDVTIGRISPDVSGLAIMVEVGKTAYKVKMIDIFKMVQAAHEKSIVTAAS